MSPLQVSHIVASLLHRLPSVACYHGVVTVVRTTFADELSGLVCCISPQWPLQLALDHSFLASCRSRSTSLSLSKNSWITSYFPTSGLYLGLLSLSTKLGSVCCTLYSKSSDSYYVSATPVSKQGKLDFFPWEVQHRRGILRACFVHACKLSWCLLLSNK
jgi:hypothetical protein